MSHALMNQTTTPYTRTLPNTQALSSTSGNLSSAVRSSKTSFVLTQSILHQQHPRQHKHRTVVKQGELCQDFQRSVVSFSSNCSSVQSVFTCWCSGVGLVSSGKRKRNPPSPLTPHTPHFTTFYNISPHPTTHHQSPSLAIHGKIRAKPCCGGR